MFNISEKDRLLLIQILATQIPEYTVIAYGSRISGKSHQGSDLDLVIIGDEKIPLQKIWKLKEVFEDSNLPFTVDVLDWNAIPVNFRKNIKKKFEVIRRPVTKDGFKETIL